MINPKTARKFTIDVGWVFISSLVAMAAGLIIRILLGNYFDAAGLGAYAMVLTIWGIVTLTTGAGAPGALIKYVAECTEDKDTRDSLASASIVNGFVMGLGAMVLFIIIAPWLESIFNIPNLGGLLRIAAISFPFVTANNSFTAYLNAVRRMKSYAAFEIYRKGIVVVFTIIFIWMGMGIPGAVWALVVAPVSVTIAQIVLQGKYFSFKMARYRECTKRLYKFGSKLFADNIVGLLNTNIATLLIGFYLLDSDVGIYAIATMFFSILLMVPSAIQRIAYPALSEYYSKQKFTSMKKLMETTMRFSFVFLSIICFILIFFVDDLISLVFPGKSDFLIAITPFRIIAIMGLLYLSIMPSNVLFNSIGRPDIPLKITIINLIINTSCAMFLIPRDITFFGLQIGGLNGAAISFGITLLFSSLVSILLVRHFAPIKIRYWNVLIGMAIFVFLLILSYVIMTQFSIDANIIGAIFIPIFSFGLYYFGIVSMGGIKKAMSVLRKK